MADDSLLQFPCNFPVKAFGKEGDDFEQTLYALIKPHAPELSMDDLSAKPSKGRKYLAVTAHIVAQSQAQLDSIYQALSDSDKVLMAL